MTHRNITSPTVCAAAVAAVLAAPAAAQDITLATAGAAVVASAQQPEIVVADTEPETGDEIVVRAESTFGLVDAGVPPVDVLDEADIQAYGASSIADLVAALAPQTSSARGRGGGPPVFLVNGLRVSSFREFRSYPPEAIEKVEILPEEVAQRYGFSADQRVMNFILKPDFASYEVEVEYEQPGAGGFHRKGGEATMLRLGRSSRLNFNVSIEDTTPMVEAVRGIIQPEGSLPDVAGDPDPAQYRTLVADSRQLELTGNYTAALGSAGASLSLNGTVERTDNLSLSGLDSVVLTDPAGTSALRTFNAADPLMVRSGTTTLSLGSTLNANAGDWQVTATLNASRARNTQEIDRRADTAALVQAAAEGTLAIDGALPALADAGFDRAETTTTSANSKLTMITRPLLLPGGEVSLTLDGGYDWLRLDSSDTRRLAGDAQLTRGNLNGGVNLAIPVTSRREGFGEGLGDVTLNLSGGVDHLSDYGTLTDWSVGLIWGVTEKLTVQTTYIGRDAAPGLSQLGNPQIVSLNVPYFDLARSETLLITTTSGGNPLLTQEKQRDWRIAANWETPLGANLSVEYNRNRSRDVTASFPLLTPAIEAAFPDRVTRDDAGRLLALDLRPVTFAQQNSSRLRIGLNMSGPLGRANPAPPVAETSDQAGPAGRGGGGGPRGGMGFGGPGGSGGSGGGNFDPARFQRLRDLFCAPVADPDAPIVLSEEQLALIPPPMLERLKGPDGTLDQAQLKDMRERFCSQDGPPRFAGGGPGAGAQGDSRQAGPATRGSRGPGRFGPGGGDGRGRWFANLTYTRELTSDVQIAPGLPVLDQLAGQSLSSTGTPQDSAQFVGGMFYRGFGVRASARYTGPAQVDGSGLPGSTDLRFGSLATLDLRLFVNLGDQPALVASQPWLKAMRLAFVVDNVFDSRRTVTDSNGDTPLRYQPLLLDPTGRYIGVDLRKVF